MPDFDLDSALAAPEPVVHTVAVAYEIYGDDRHGEMAELERGWQHPPEEPVHVEPDEYDIGEDKTAVDLTVDYLRGEGAVEASASHFHQGVWYICNGDMDRQGCYLNRSYHLKGFTEDEELQVFQRITGRGQLRGRLGPLRPV